MGGKSVGKWGAGGQGKKAVLGLEKVTGQKASPSPCMRSVLLRQCAGPLQKPHSN